MKIAHSEAHKQESGSSGFKSFRWIVCGASFIIIASIGHVVLLPFADMTLFASTCSIAILMNAFLSMNLLGEKFVCAYDMTAALLICISSTMTVLQMNTQVDVVYDIDYVLGLLVSFEAFCLCGGVFFLGSTMTGSILVMRNRVNNFSIDFETPTWSCV